MKNKYYSVLPIGGVEEIGSNMTLIRTADEDLIIDCGLLFPYEECFDISYLVPDFSLLDPRRIKNVIITHGHEDHIGGLGQLLRKFPDLVVHATPFTLHLLQKKLEEFNVKLTYKLLRPGQEYAFSGVDLIPVHVNHSIPETTGLIIRSKGREWGSLYISDFKVDLTASHEAPIDFQLIKQKLSECQHTAYFMDSTNVIYDGKTTSENELHADLDHLLSGSQNRIFITLFASNVHRLTAIANFAKSQGRKIVVMGRSLWTYLEAARETGHTDLTQDDLWLPEQVKGQSGKMLIFLSGCQGDFLSALRRFSFGEDGTFKPAPGDRVIFSSKVIPGNEKKIYRIYNKLTQFGAEVVTASDYLIHASGHPGKKDLRMLLENFTPDFYFPIHGESYMLKKHFDWIRSDFPQITPGLIHNYQEVLLTEQGFKVESHEQKEPRLIHGNHHEIEKSQISQRRKMATQGAVFISYHASSGQLDITPIGLPIFVQEEQEKLKTRLTDLLRSELSRRDQNYVKDQIKIATRQYYNQLLGYKPVTEVHLL